MLKSGGKSGNKKKPPSPVPLSLFYPSWLETLRSSLLPLLRPALKEKDPTTLPSAVAAVHSHFQSHLAALDLAARHDPSQLLSPAWRSPIETPFLWLADLHPSLLTALLRSFRLPSAALATRADQIDRGLRLIVPAISRRLKDSRSRFAERVAVEWALSGGRESGDSEAVRAFVEELEGLFGDANRLRRSVLAEIVGACDVYQAARYLEALAEFVLGFRDEDLVRNFEQWRVADLAGV